MSLTSQSRNKYDAKQTKEFIKRMTQFGNEYFTQSDMTGQITLWQSFMKEAEQYINNGADPNAKGENRYCLLLFAGLEARDVNGKNAFIKMISENKLDVNTTLLGGQPLISYFMQDARCSFAAKALFEMGCNLDVSAKNSNKKGKPFDYEEFLFPRSQISYISTIQEGLILNQIRNRTFEENLASINKKGLAEFYFLKLDEKVDALLQVLIHKAIGIDPHFSSFELKALLERVAEANAKKAELSEEDKKLYEKYMENKKVLDQLLALDALSGFAISQEDTINQVQEFLKKLENITGEKISLEELKKPPLRLLHPNDMSLYFGLTEENQKKLNSHYEILNDVKQIVMFAHKLGLDGTVELENSEYQIDQVSLTGNVIFNTLPAVSKSLQKFHESVAYNEFIQNNQDSKKDHEAVLNLIIETYKRAETPHLDKSEETNWVQTAAAYKEGKPVIFESRWERHSAMTIVYKDRMYICNKGAGTWDLSIKCYKIGDPSALLGQNAAKKFQELSTFERISKRPLGELSGLLPWGARFSNQEMMKELNLTRIKVNHIKGQKVGNCTYTNTKRGIDGIILALQDRSELDKEMKDKYPSHWPPEWKNKQSASLGIDISKIDRKSFYHAFGLHDRLDAIEGYFTRLDKISRTKLPLSHQTYLDPLLMVLRDQNNINSKRNLAVGNKILNGLRARGYTDEEIYKRMLSLPPKETIFTIAMRFTELIDKELDTNVRDLSRQEFWRMLLPGGQRYQSNEFLRAIGFDEKVLRTSSWEIIREGWQGSKKTSSLTVDPPSQSGDPQPDIQLQSQGPPSTSSSRKPVPPKTERKSILPFYNSSSPPSDKKTEPPKEDSASSELRVKNK